MLVDTSTSSTFTVQTLPASSAAWMTTLCLWLDWGTLKVYVSPEALQATASPSSRISTDFRARLSLISSSTALPSTAYWVLLSKSMGTTTGGVLSTPKFSSAFFTSSMFSLIFPAASTEYTATAYTPSSAISDLSMV